MTPAEPSTLPRPEVVTEATPGTRPGWISLVTGADHKSVGRMYVATALAFAALAVTELVLLRIHLIVPDSTILRPEIFDRLISAYGPTALLLFVVPLLLGLISYVVPLQIGARGVALPRVGALSYWLYLFGGLTLYASFMYSPSEAGMFALPPLAAAEFSLDNGTDAWILAVGLATLGFVLFAVNMAATLRTARGPGMVWRRVPLFSWAAGVISWTLLVVGPVMLAALAMLFIDRNFDGVFFDPGEGGSPRLYEHMSSIFFTGAYVAVVVGAFGAISEIFSTFSRQPHFGHRTIAGSMVAFAVLGVLAWMTGMYPAPIGIGFLYFAMLMAVAALVPVGLIVFNWIATLSGGATDLKPPMLFAVGAVVFTLLGLAGELAQAVIPVGWQLTGTMVAWGDTHLALIGAGVLGGFAALHYWFPKITGRLMGGGLAGASFWTIALGTVLMVVPLQLAGLEGMPAEASRYFADTGISTYNLLGSIGAFVLAIGIVLTLVNAAVSYGGGAEVGHDPWGGSTLEWFALSPPPAHNFDLVPDVRSNEPLLDIREAIRRRTTRWTPPPAVDPEAAREPEPVAAEDAGSGPAEPATRKTANEPVSGPDEGEDPVSPPSQGGQASGERPVSPDEPGGGEPAGDEGEEGASDSPDDEHDGPVA